MKKKFTYILAIILVLTLIFSNNVIAYGSSQAVSYQSPISICQERAELFLENIGHPVTVTNPVTLNNLANKPEAILFTTSDNGYIIVNINDLSIPELSLDDSSPFNNYDNPVYNGPLEYYYEQNGQIKSILDNSIVEVNQLSEYYTRQRINDQQEYLTSLYLTYQANNARNLRVEKYLSAPLQEWYIPGGNCGSIASAICMRYYYDNVSTRYVDSNNISENPLIRLMQRFVGAGGTNYSDLVNGLNSYFRSRNINNTAAKMTPFSFDRVKRSIFADRPIIVGTHKHPEYNEHWIIAHGYFESRADGKYLIINDGWRHNNVWIEPNTTTLDGTIYFSN